MAIVTSKFRVAAASGFATRFAIDSIYMVLGRPQSWDNALSTNFALQSGQTTSDTAPPTPADNYVNEHNLWRDAMAAVRVNQGDVRLCTVRHNWISGTRYDMYRPDINAIQSTATGKFNLSEGNMIVYVTSNSSVYKCLYNGANATFTTGIVSTVAPTSTSFTPQTTADGYIWKFMYTITAGDADFITANYIPVPTNTSSISNRLGLDVILVTNGGNYSSNPTVIIYGDGTSAAAVAVSSAGAITGITITEPGSGYSWAKIVFSATTVNANASAIAIIAPSGGHGSNLASECNAHNVMIVGSAQAYQGSDIPVNQDFRTVALVKNPVVYQTSSAAFTTTVVSVADTARIAGTLVMTSSATTAPANDIVLSNTTGASVLAVFQSSTTTNLQFIQPLATDTSVINSVELSRIDSSTTRRLKTFANGDIISGIGGYSQAISSVTSVSPELQHHSGELLYLDYRAPVTRNLNQNEKINIVVNF
jgi:hypothetical protein